MGDTRFCVPVIDFLIDRFTIRAYFDIIDPLSSKEKDAFGGFFGKVLERYIHLLLTEMFGPPGRHLGRWFLPSQYERSRGTPEGPDAVILGNQGNSLSAIFLEVKSSRPNRDVVVSGDLSKLADNWHRYLIGTSGKPKAARQLDRSIKDFRSGKFRLPGVDQSSVSIIYPVIITLDPWPLYMEVYEAFCDDVGSFGLLQDSAVAPIDVWSCFDLEFLSPQVLAGRSLFDLIARRPKGKAHLPLWVQLQSRGLVDNVNSPLLKATWERIRSTIVNDLQLKG